MTSRLHLSLEMLELIKEHLSSPDALAVKLDRVVLEVQVVDFLLLCCTFNTSLFFFDLFLKVFLISLLSEQSLKFV